MAVVFKNNATTTLNGSILAGATSITVTNGAVFPTVTARTNPTSPVDNGHYNDPTQSSSTNSTTAGDYFYATITDGTNREVVKVTNVSGNTLTVTRGQDGTSGTAFASGSTIEIRPTNQGLIDLGDDRFYRDVATRSRRYLGA